MTKATKHSFYVKTPPLGGKHLASLRLKLFKRERELATELAAINDEALSKAATWTGVASWALPYGADPECARLAAKARLLPELSQIHRAKQRILQGTYGKCVDCGGWISAQRLDLLPCGERCEACHAASEGTNMPGSPTLPHRS